MLSGLAAWREQSSVYFFFNLTQRRKGANRQVIMLSGFAAWREQIMNF